MSAFGVGLLSGFASLPLNVAGPMGAPFAGYAVVPGSFAALALVMGLVVLTIAESDASNAPPDRLSGGATEDEPAKAQNSGG